MATAVAVAARILYAAITRAQSGGRVRTISASEAGLVAIAHGPSRLGQGELGVSVTFLQNRLRISRHGHVSV